MVDLSPTASCLIFLRRSQPFYSDATYDHELMTPSRAAMICNFMVLCTALRSCGSVRSYRWLLRVRPPVEPKEDMFSLGRIIQIVALIGREIKLQNFFTGMDVAWD